MMGSKIPSMLTELRLAVIPQVSTAWATLAVVVGLFFVLEYFFAVKQAPKEPPLAKSSIPYIGHTVGLLRHKMQYYIGLR